jgi:hypothetical protein
MSQITLLKVHEMPQTYALKAKTGKAK